MEYLIPVMCKKLCIPCDLDLEKVIPPEIETFLLLVGETLQIMKMHVHFLYKFVLGMAYFSVSFTALLRCKNKT